MNDPSEQPESEAADDAETTSVTLEINIAGEKVQFTVTLPTGPASWEQLLPFMRALVQVGSDISQENVAANGSTISCRAGCGICCRQRVPIAEFEAHRLRRLVESMPEPRRTEIMARFRASEERVRAAGNAVSLDCDVLSTSGELIRRSVNYFKMMIPCPFLENESCSIYEERPLKCREYLVTSPAEHCAEPQNERVVGLPILLNVYRTTLFLDAGQEKPGMRCVPLDRLLAWTDAHDEEPPTRTGPELLRELMAKLTQPKP